jgi:hypothetical protein
MHKKIIYSGVAIGAIAAMTAVNMSFGTKSNELSAVSSANVEALAQGEGNPNTKCKTNMGYDFRQELCGSGTMTTSLSITSYSCVSGAFPSCQEGSIITGTGCYGYVNTNSVTTKNC